MKKPLNIVVIEDNTSYREVIRLAIERDEDLLMGAEFGTAEIALRELKESSDPPDLILLDLNLPGMSGVEAMPYFLEFIANVKVLVLSQSNAEQDILRSISLGASGYILKSTGVQEIRRAIKDVCAGGAILDPSVAKYLVGLIHSNRKKAEAKNPLTDRELMVIKLLSEGCLKKEISEQLKISYSTVDTHVRHIYDKLDARNAPAAVTIAHRIGILK